MSKSIIAEKYQEIELDEATRGFSEMMKAMNNFIASRPMYIIVEYPQENKTVTVTGTTQTMAAWLNDYMVKDWKVVGLTDDRNAARKRAEEIG